MTSLDDISFTLGKLSAGVASLVEASERKDRHLQQLDRHIGDLRTSIGEVKTRMKPLTDDVSAMKPHVETVKRVKRHAVWAGSTLVALIVAAAGTIAEFVMRKLGGE